MGRRVGGRLREGRRLAEGLAPPKLSDPDRPGHCAGGVDQPQAPPAPELPLEQVQAAAGPAPGTQYVPTMSPAVQTMSEDGDDNLLLYTWNCSGHPSPGPPGAAEASGGYDVPGLDHRHSLRRLLRDRWFDLGEE